MTRLTAGAVALLMSAATLGAAAGARAASAPRAQLTHFVCQNALDPSGRSVSVTAVMRPLSGTRRMQLRFTLLSQQPGTGEAPVRAGDLGSWISPANPTLGQLPGDVWNLQKQVVPLAAPAAYRFRVQFRWLGVHGKLLDLITRSTADCRQHELRPDLRVTAITVAPLPGRPDEDLYTADIANDGNSAAGPFRVLFAPGDGSAPTTHTVALLRAHQSRTETFAGPLCTAATAPTVTVDPALQVHDLNRANNAMTATCPPTATG